MMTKLPTSMFALLCILAVTATAAASLTAAGASLTKAEIDSFLRETAVDIQGTTGETKHWMGDGCPEGGTAWGWALRAPDSTNKAGVRCCSDDSCVSSCDSGPAMNAATNVDGKGAPTKATYSQAEDHCSKLGKRLCTREELDANKCCKRMRLRWQVGLDQL